MSAARPVLLRASGNEDVGLGHLQHRLAVPPALPGVWWFSAPAAPDILASLNWS